MNSKFYMESKPYVSYILRDICYSEYSKEFADRRYSKESSNNCSAKKLAEEKRRKKILFSVECARMALAADERRKKYLFAAEIRSAVDARLARLSPSVDDDLIPPLNVKVTAKPRY